MRGGNSIRVGVGRHHATMFCLCAWEGFTSIGIGERDVLAALDEYEEGQDYRMDLIIQDCALLAVI